MYKIQACPVADYLARCRQYYVTEDWSGCNSSFTVPNRIQQRSA